ncbi:MAG TPA: hypothetical protein VK676_08340 [Steroidobacteraceae bacterium]|nr:hypothetical protein [Steroidobacteraceae bacterium]
METVVVTASRTSAFNLSEMEILVGSVVLIALLAWMVLSRGRRGSHQPHA